MEDEECPAWPKKFEDKELEALLDANCCQAQEKLAETFEVTQAAKRSKTFESSRVHL